MQKVGIVVVVGTNAAMSLVSRSRSASHQGGGGRCCLPLLPISLSLAFRW